jgi:hypothetical protein
MVAEAHVADIITQVLRRLGETDTSAPTRWTRDEILDYINEGISEANVISWEIQATGTIPLNVTDNVYALPDANIAPLSVYTNSRYLLRQSIDDLDNELTDWESAISTASVPRIWCPFGLTQILVSPRTTTGAVLYVTSLVEPMPRIDADQEVGLRVGYEQAIEDYAYARALFKEGGAEFQQSQVEYQRYLDVVQQLAGRNILELRVLQKAETADITPRHAAEPQQQGR